MPAPTWDNMLGPIEDSDLMNRIAPHITAPCLVGNHAACRGIVRSLAGDRECECPLTDAHDHVHVYEDEPADDDIATWSRRPV